MNKANEAYDRLVSKFVSELEAGVAPWVKPWTSGNEANFGLPYNAASKRNYHGVNVLMLWSAAQERGYPQGAWLTYKQARELGGNVRKGERGELVLYFNQGVRKVEDANGDEVEKAFRILRAFVVFNVAQCEGLGLTPPVPVKTADEAEDDADRFILGTGARIERGGDRACFVPSLDAIHMPPRSAFTSREADQATLLHELGHWSGASARLNRQFGKRFGDEAYATEELVAELTSAFLCADLGITGHLQHASYLDSWAKALKARPTILWTAASKASEAASYLSQLQSG